MKTRASLAADFLSRTDWATAERRLLAGDASNRRYDRLHDLKTHQTAVFMDAPPEKGEDIRPFVRIAHHLRSVGLTAPKIIAQDPTQGFMILEDLGDDLFARVLEADPAQETTLYHAAADVLLDLHKHALPDGLDAYTPQIMADLAGLAFDWYLPVAGAENPNAKPAFCDLFLPLLETTTSAPQVLIQRDYHAENLLWLPDRQGIKRVGLLDFQDALAGHPAYDLVSLLQDARRDVSGGIATKIIARFVEKSGAPQAEFEATYHILGAQRNLRILGVFARLCLRDGKAGYVDLIPRVWAHLMTDIAHPALAPVASLIKTSLPAPSPDVLERIKEKCAAPQ